MQLKKSLQSWKKWLFFKRKVVFILMAAFILVVSLYNLLSIKEISCFCDGDSCQTTVCEQLKSQISKNYLFLSKHSVTSLVGPSKSFEKLEFQYKFPFKLVVNLTKTSNYLIFNTAISNSPLALSMNMAPISSDSAVPFNKPTEEIADYVSKINTISLKVYPEGQFEVIATESSKIFNINTSKKDQLWYKEVLELIKTVTLYTEVVGIYILDNDLYFARSNSSDLIISLDQEQEKTLKALQLLGFLNTIKKDQKIIDLRYTNPIIR